MIRQQESLCKDCITTANRRAQISYGIPITILVVFSIVALIVDIAGIIDAMGQVEFEAKLEPVL